MKPKVTILHSAEIPEDLLQAFIQHIRDFDTAHAECHFRMLVDAEANKTAQQISAMCDGINPPLPVRKLIRKN